jgi:hypothetical protein
MVVDIINKTLNTTAIVKIQILIKPTEPFYFSYFDGGHFMKTREPALFWYKVDEMGTKIFYPLNCLKAYKKVSYEGHLLASENKTLIEFKRNTDFVVEQPYTYTLFLAFIVLNKTHQSILPQRNGIIRNLLHGLVCIRHI